MLDSLKKVIIGSLLMAVALPGCGTSTGLTNNSQDLIAPVDNTVVAESDKSPNNKYRLIEIIGIGEVYAQKLNEVGLKYTDEYLKATAKRYDRLKLAEKTGISAKLLLTWANHVDLMRIMGVGPKQSNWLEAVGVDSMKELGHRVVTNLYPRLEIANNIDPKRKFVQRMPSAKTVQSWIDASKTLDTVVEQ
jgi:predicted flap endonuclease-1-like 5' DNA nuclease